MVAIVISKKIAFGSVSLVDIGLMVGAAVTCLVVVVTTATTYRIIISISIRMLFEVKLNK